MKRGKTVKLLSRKKLILVAVLPVVWVLARITSAKYGGTGVPGDPFLIETPADFGVVPQ